MIIHEILIHEIKCDADGCGYRTPIVPVALETYLDAACPLCGASLLTAKDLAATNYLLAMAAYSRALHPMPEGSTRVVVPILMDGTGTIEFGDPK